MRNLVPPSAARQLLRVVDRLYNADLPLQRNRLHAQLHPLIQTIFQDLADQDPTSHCLAALQPGNGRSFC
jgi:hypothetical protein